MLKFSTPLIRTFAVAAFVGSVSFAAAPLHAQTMGSSEPMDGASQTTTAATPAETHAEKRDARVEERIKTLHDKLMITPAEENDWGAVADTMRDNEQTMNQLIMDRHANPDSMSAVDDLQSYQKIAQAHADGMQKMVSSFSTLYNEMSDSQKKNADVVFGTFEGHRHGKMKHHA